MTFISLLFTKKKTFYDNERNNLQFLKTAVNFINILRAKPFSRNIFSESIVISKTIFHSSHERHFAQSENQIWIVNTSKNRKSYFIEEESKENEY